MKKLAAIALATALVIPATAEAKEISKLRLCGASDCRSTSDRRLLGLIGEGADGGTAGSTPSLQPYYRLTYTVTLARDERPSGGRRSFTFTIWYAPRAGETRGTDERGNAVWLPATPAFRTALARLTRGLVPYPTPRVTGVRVAGREVADPASYARLLTIGGRDAGFVNVGDWQPIGFGTTPSGPWSTVVSMLFSPRTGILARDNGYLKLPGGVADAVRAGEALPSGGAFPAWGYGVVGAALAAATGTLVLLIRRRARRPRPAPRTA